MKITIWPTDGDKLIINKLKAKYPDAKLDEYDSKDVVNIMNFDSSIPVYVDTRDLTIQWDWLWIHPWYWEEFSFWELKQLRWLAGSDNVNIEINIRNRKDLEILGRKNNIF